MKTYISKKEILYSLFMRALQVCILILIYYNGVTKILEGKFYVSLVFALFPASFIIVMEFFILSTLAKAMQLLFPSYTGYRKILIFLVCVVLPIAEVLLLKSSCFDKVVYAFWQHKKYIEAPSDMILPSLYWSFAYFLDGYDECEPQFDFCNRKFIESLFENLYRLDQGFRLDGDAITYCSSISDTRYYLMHTLESIEILKVSSESKNSLLEVETPTPESRNTFSLAIRVYNAIITYEDYVRNT